jgi:phosphatidylserine synthase
MAQRLPGILSVMKILFDVMRLSRMNVNAKEFSLGRQSLKGMPVWATARQTLTPCHLAVVWRLLPHE